MNKILVFFSCFYLINVSLSANILFLHPLSTISHQVFLNPFMELLISHNHNVTILTNALPAGVNFKLSPNVNSHSYEISDKVFKLINDLCLNTFKKEPHKILCILEREIGFDSCQIFLQQTFLQQIVNSKTKYDVVFVHGLMELCSVPVAYLLSDNVIFLQFQNSFPPFTDKFDLPRPYSYIPFTQSLLQSDMTLVERTWNALISLSYSNFYLQDESYDKVIHKYFPQAPTSQVAYQKHALTFVNEDPVLTRATVVMPHAIAIGGLNCRKPNPLPQELHTITTNAEDNGIIYFSLGTVIKAEQLSEKLPLIFLSVFSRLNQTVIWKSSNPLNGAPKNVKFISWAPQQDILGHSKTRLYICQGGIFSLHEAIYHGVPVLGLPIFSDQFSNIKRMEELGIGLYLDAFELSEEKLYSAITALLHNKRFSDNAKKYAEIFKSQPVSAMERMIYWTEYIIRHNGTHLQSASRYVNNFIYFSVDVLTVLIFSISIVSFISVKIIGIICKQICNVKLYSK